MRLTYGVPYMAKYGKWKLSVVYVVAPTRIGCVLVSRWSSKGKKWSQSRILAGGICREATELDCVSRGADAPSKASWKKLHKQLAKANGAAFVEVPWGFAVTFNYWG